MGMLSEFNSKHEIPKMTDYMVDYIEEFLSTMRLRSTSDKTVVNYRSDFNMLARTMFDYENYRFLKLSDFENLSVSDIIKYFKTLHQEGTFSNQTLNRRLSSLKSLLQYLVGNEVIQFPINQLMVNLKSLPKTPERIDVFTIKEADECISELLKLPKGNITSLMAKLSIDTGLRANELLTLTWRQFYPKENTVIVKSVGKIKGKGSKDWRVEISKEFYQELLTLKDKSDRVFNISYSYLVKLMNKTLEVMKLDDKNYSFHSFRKRGVTNAFIESNNNILVAKQVANHSSIATTEIYLEEVQGAVMGYYSKGNKVDSDLYKKVDNELLINTLEEIGGDFIHRLNMLLNSKINKS